MNIKTIQSGVSSCISAMSELNASLANLAGQVNDYENQLKIDTSLDWFRKSATFFELVPPKQNMVLDLPINYQIILNDSSLERIHTAFSDAGYLIIVNCLDAPNI